MAPDRGNLVMDVVQRMEDIWNAVLADDFVFNFRNCIATKAYNDLEREFSKLLMKIEENLLQFLNVTCKVEQQKCQTEEELQKCNSRQTNALNEKLAELQRKSLSKLEEFFKAHTAKEILDQWKSEKERSLRLAAEALKRETQLKLERMYGCRLFELRQQNTAMEHEQMVIENSKQLAEELRGKDPTQDELKKQFQEMWAKCASDFEAAESRQRMTSAIDVFQNCLWDAMGTNNEMFLKSQLEATPLTAYRSLRDIPELEIQRNHITIKGRPFSAATRMFGIAAEKANDIMKTVMTKVDELCQQDILFEAYHGRRIIYRTMEEVSKHNRNGNAKFSFTPEFTAMLAVRVACCAAPKFDEMNQKYEDEHGVKTRLNKYKQRVFRLFENAVKDATTEVTASADFCEVIKGQLIDYIRTKLDQKILQEIFEASGRSKYDLITMILDEIVDEQDFDMLMQYVDEPFSYVKQWIHKFGERHIFQQETPSKYHTFAAQFATEAVRRILASTRHATEAENNSTRNLYKDWVAVFCADVETTLPLNTSRLDTKYEIKNLKQYQESIESGLKDLETAINDEFKSVTADSVRWCDGKSPFQHAFERLWGCQQMCPFCNEPCQFTDSYHTTPHRCIQHRPAGTTGTRIKTSKELDLTTCNMNVASQTKQFNCLASTYQCRESGGCKASGNAQQWHSYREYQKYTKRWDIPPDPACEAAQFWQWAMATFRTNLEQRYAGTTLDTLDSWKTITAELAKSSLRVFRTTPSVKDC